MFTPDPMSQLHAVHWSSWLRAETTNVKYAIFGYFPTWAISVGGQGVACCIWGVSKKYNLSSRGINVMFSAVWSISDFLKAPRELHSRESDTKLRKCTHGQIAQLWLLSGRASPIPGWQPAARSLKSSPSSEYRLRPPPCPPSCHSGRRSAAPALCTLQKSACIFHHRRRARPSVGLSSCALWCCGRSTPRIRAPRHRWGAQTVTTKVSPSSQRRNRHSSSSSAPVPTSCHHHRSVVRTRAHPANRSSRTPPAPSPSRRQIPAGRSSRAPGRVWWLCWSTTDWAATIKSRGTVVPVNHPNIRGFCDRK